MSIRENLEAIRAEIDAAARETGRTGADITLVGASKMNDAAACQEAIAAGIDALGENRVQEMTAGGGKRSGTGEENGPCAGAGTDDHTPGGRHTGRKCGIFPKSTGTIC